MADSLTAELKGRAEESLRGPLKVEVYDNMGDAFVVMGQVPGEVHDQYPHYDEARHAVRAKAIGRIPEMLSMLGRAEGLVRLWGEIVDLDDPEVGLCREIVGLFDELNRIGEETERMRPRESAEDRGEGFVDDADDGNEAEVA